MIGNRTAKFFRERSSFFRGPEPSSFYQPEPLRAIKLDEPFQINPYEKVVLTFPDCSVHVGIPPKKNNGNFTSWQINSPYALSAQIINEGRSVIPEPSSLRGTQRIPVFSLRNDDVLYIFNEGGQPTTVYNDIVGESHNTRVFLQLPSSFDFLTLKGPFSKKPGMTPIYDALQSGQPLGPDLMLAYHTIRGPRLPQRGIQ